MTAPAGTAPPHGARLPGLDGLRAVAVLGVLGYHSDWGWLRGGFLGVSLFFTLSGFLITRLLLDERLRHGRIDLRRFWSRRARRLLPAAVAAMLLATAVTAAVGTASQRINLVGDAAAALLYVVNWRFVVEGATYAGLYEAPSMLQHLWSLAVEEQLYVVVPLLLSGLLLRGRRAALAVIVGLVAAVGLVTAWASGDAALETLYYGSHVRAGELLVGVALALLISVPDRQAPSWARALVGPVATGAVLLTWYAWRFADLQLYRGGLLLHALLVAAALWAITSGPSLLTNALEHRSLVWVGRRSYGIYLYHWPLFLLAEQTEVEVSRAVLLAAAWAGSLVLAGVSYVALEQPIRTAARVRGGAQIAAGLVGAPVVAILLALAVSAGQQPVHDPDAAAARLDALARGETSVDGPATTTTTTTEAPPAPTVPPPTDPPPAPVVTERPVRIAIFGDSIAAANTLGFAEWVVEHPAFELVPGVTIPGCALVAEGTRWSGESPIHIEAGCDWQRGWPGRIAEHQPHIALIATGALDALPWSLPGEDGRFQVGDAPVDERIRREVDGINDLMAFAGVEAIWLTLPGPARDNNTQPSLDRINQLIEDAAADRDNVRVADMAAMVNRWNDEGLQRSDGVHLDIEDARRLGQELILPAIVALVGEP